MIEDVWLNLVVLICVSFIFQSFFQLLDALFVFLISVVRQSEQVEHIRVLIVHFESLVKICG